MPATRIIAIDGPAGAGKSTVARQLARRLGFVIIDTGAIYRSVALAALRAGIDPQDDAALEQLLSGPRFSLDFAPAAEEGEAQRVVLSGEDVTAAIRTPEVSRVASIVSARPVVRQRLLGLQRDLGRQARDGAVLEGRDIGTVVFPDAPLKLFLTASDEARAARRHAELAGQGIEAQFAQVLADQRRRDRDDTERLLSPLRPAADAVFIDTTGLDLEQVIDRCTSLAKDRLGPQASEG